MLQQLTGKEYPQLKPLRADVKLAPPNPGEMEAWVQLASVHRMVKHLAPDPSLPPPYQRRKAA